MFGSGRQGGVSRRSIVFGGASAVAVGVLARGGLTGALAQETTGTPEAEGTAEATKPGQALRDKLAQYGFLWSATSPATHLGDVYTLTLENTSAGPVKLWVATIMMDHRQHQNDILVQEEFELAAGGTLFLDEIGDLRLDLQAKLLRAIQEGEIERVGGSKPIKTDFRLIVATNVDLEKAVKEGRFRDDLYYRINVIPIRMPPLRERIEDLPELAKFFLRRCNTKFRKHVTAIEPSTLRVLSSYWWPGNIRELENLIERLVAVSDKDTIGDEDLPLEYHFAQFDAQPEGRPDLFQQACDTFERNFILRALERSDWNVSATARYLGMPLSTLKHKMGRFEIRELARRLRNV